MPRIKRPPCVFLAALPAILGPVMSAVAGAASAAVSAVGGALGAVGGAVTGAASAAWSGLGALGGTVGLSAGQTAMLGASLIGTGVSTGTSVVGSKNQQKVADAQLEQAEAAAQFAEGQANVAAGQKATLAAQKRFAQQRQAAEMRGRIQASGLPVQSVRALVRNVEAQRGRGGTAIGTQLEFAGQARAGALTESRMSLAGQRLSIGASRPSSGAIAGEAFGNVLGGVGDTVTQGFEYKDRNIRAAQGRL